MSSDRPLAGWIAALYAALDEAEPHRAAAIRKLAGERTASIGLDSDWARVSFEGGTLISDPTTRPHPPTGRTDSATAADLLDGYVEVSQAIAEGRIEIEGTTDDVIAIAGIVEVLVDASTRIPAMQALSKEFLAARPASGGAARHRARLTEQARRSARESAFLSREGLLDPGR